MKLFGRVFIKIELIIVSMIFLGSLYYYVTTIKDNKPVFVILCYALIVGITGLLLHHFAKTITNHKTKLGILLMTLILSNVLIRVLVLYYMNIEQQGDYQIYLSTAYKLYANLEIGHDYYSVFPHALNYPVFVSLLYKIIFRRWFVTGVHIGFSIIEVISVFFILRQYSSLKKSGFYTLVLTMNPISILMIMFTGGESIYSGLISVVILLCVLLSNKVDTRPKKILLCILIGTVLSLANFFRPTAVIMVIALVLTFLLSPKEGIKNKLIPITVILISYVCIGLISSTLTTHYTGVTSPEKAFGWNLYVGANYDTHGGWSSEDSQVLIAMMKEGKTADEIQSAFFEKGTLRYIQLFRDKQLVQHLVNKLFIWQSTEFISKNSMGWQTKTTRYITGEMTSLVEVLCFSYQMIIVTLMFGVLLAKRFLKSHDFTVDMIGLYIIGIMMMFLLLEASSRYNMAYLNAMGIFTVVGLIKIGEKRPSSHLSLLGYIRQRINSI